MTTYSGERKQTRENAVRRWVNLPFPGVPQVSRARTIDSCLQNSNKLICHPKNSLQHNYIN